MPTQKHQSHAATHLNRRKASERDDVREHASERLRGLNKALAIYSQGLDKYNDEMRAMLFLDKLKLMLIGGRAAASIFLSEEIGRWSQQILEDAGQLTDEQQKKFDEMIASKEKNKEVVLSSIAMLSWGAWRTMCWVAQKATCRRCTRS